MGICDLIPGISGGTIAFITGIYERLINSIKNLSDVFYNILLFFITLKKKRLKIIKESWEKSDILFLIILLAGIISALLLGANLIKFLLENYFTFTLSFFIGLIIASSLIIFEHIDEHHHVNRIFGLIGLLIGVSFIFLIPINPAISLSYVFLGGFIAISAMFLPGISGSFILLILGLYETMIDSLTNIPNNLNIIIVFIIGAILGAFFISRLINFLFRNYKNKTLYFLLGLVIGSLSVPLKRIYQTTIFRIDTIAFIVTFFLLGMFIVILFKYYEKSVISISNQ